MWLVAVQVPVLWLDNLSQPEQAIFIWSELITDRVQVRVLWLVDVRSCLTVIGWCVQVLTVVKHRLDNYLVTVSNYESLLIQASQYLAWRDEVMRQGSDGITRRDSVLSLPSNWSQRPSSGSASGTWLLAT